MRASVSQSLLLCSSLVACQDALAPADLAPADFVGYYRLRTVNESQLPVVVTSLPPGCSTSFRFGSMFLADGPFSMVLFMPQDCPALAAGGVYTPFGPFEFGGGLSVEGRSLRLRWVDPTSASGGTLEAVIAIYGLDAVLTLPPGTLKVATATSLRFGPRKPDALTP